MSDENASLQGVGTPKRKELRSVWEEFMRSGRVLPAGVVREEILESWGRSRSHGLDPRSRPEAIFTRSVDEVGRILHASADLVEAAKPFLLALGELMKDLDLVLFLTDRKATVLEATGAGASWEDHQSLARRFGGDGPVGWDLSEESVGATAYTICMVLDRPYSMAAEEHYLEAIHGVSTMAAPIRDGSGAVIGSLGVSAENEVRFRHPHAVGMVVSAAKAIENQLKFQREHAKSFLMQQYLQAAMQALTTGILLLDRHDNVTHANAAAERALGISLSTLKDRRVDNVIKNELILQAIRERGRLEEQETILQESINKIRCLVSFRPIRDEEDAWIGSVLLLKELKIAQNLVKKITGLTAVYTFDDLLGNSSQMKDAIRLAKTLAENMANVVIVGESGTGKELFAQSIHNASRLREGPFLAINCAAIPHDLIESELFGYEPGAFTGAAREGKSGKLELANGGTLFLDEINAMPLPMQAKLLRVLEERRFLRIGGKKYFHLDARIIAASNKDLHEEIENGSFRSDLYYRLSVFELRVPSLRERADDVEYLAATFARRVAEECGKGALTFAPEARAYLKTHSWPGNVRELKNWIERAVYLAEGSQLTADRVSERPPRPEERAPAEKAAARSLPLGSTLGHLENAAVMAALEDARGNISEAAKRLGVARATLYRKLRKHGLALSKTVVGRDS